MTSTLCSLVLALAAACFVALAIRGGGERAIAAISTLACGLACAVPCVDAAGLDPEAASMLAALAVVATGIQAVVSWLIVRAGADARWAAASGAALVLFVLSACLLGAQCLLMEGVTPAIERCLYWLILAAAMAAVLILSARGPMLGESIGLMRGLLVGAIAAHPLVLTLSLIASKYGIWTFALVWKSMIIFVMPVAVALAIAGGAMAASRARDHCLGIADGMLVAIAFLMLEFELVADGFLPDALLLLICGGIAVSFATRDAKWLGVSALAAMLLAGAAVAVDSALQERLGVWLGLWADPFGLGWERTYNWEAIASGGALGSGLQALQDMPRLSNGDYFPLLAQSYGLVGVFAAAALGFVALAIVARAALGNRGDAQVRCLALCVAPVLALHVLEPLLEFFGLLPPMSVCSPFSAWGYGGRIDLVVLLVLVSLFAVRKADSESVPCEQESLPAQQSQGADQR